jgi:Pyruvate:ferredoxin oxidoreductase and related 2-oxoacid:ferredoxin oxidoreductases, alpha subunit
VAQLHLRHLVPFPTDLGEVLAPFERILIPELNNGQLVRLIRDRYLKEAIPFDKIQGRPFLAEELLQKIKELLPND